MRVLLFILCVFTLLPLGLHQGLSKTAFAQTPTPTTPSHETHTMMHTGEATGQEEHGYHCPMHPEITGEKGGRCPICGMFLTPTNGALHQNMRHTDHGMSAPMSESSEHMPMSMPMHEHEDEDEDEQEQGQMQEHGGHQMSPSPTAKTMPKNGKGDEVYICPMHPHITGKKGDNCPICGMHLVPKEQKNNQDDAENNHNHKDDGAFMISPTYKQALGVQTASVSYGDMARNIRGYGRIMPSTRLEHAVNVRTEGWIVDLVVSAKGDEVKKGDLLFTYYSPDLMNAQADFLIGSRLGNSAQRLRLYGMDEQTIAALKKRKKFFEKTPFYAPANGNVSVLNTREGAFIKQGGNVMMLQGYGKVWVMADLPLKDVQFLNVGTPANVIFPETAQKYKTHIDYIYPESDPQSRRVQVRLILDNANGDIKPETYVDIYFHADEQKRLSVPEEAILYSKAGAYVFEDIGEGYFRPVMVDTGITANGMTEIKKGLKQGQKIVTSGQFMLDAESNLKGGMGHMGHNHMAMAGDTAQITPQATAKPDMPQGSHHAH